MKYTLASLIDDKPNKRKYVFELFTSVNNRYLIVEDNVFDFETQTELGNIWESIDNFKAIFNNTIVDNTEYRIVRESILSLPILENNNTLYGLRDILLEYDFFNDTWLGREMKKDGKGVTDALKTSWEGSKKFIEAVGSGEWSEILKLLQQGVFYIFRKLKDALYSTTGSIIDAILVATGVGKTVQWIPWALVTALDIYQLVNNNWPPEEKNDPLWSKYLTIGTSVLGLASTGAVAIAAKKGIAPLKVVANNPSKLAAYLLGNPKLKTILQKMVDASSIASSKIKSAYAFIKTKFPAGAKFLAEVIGYMDNFFTKFSDSINKLINPKNVKKGAIAGSKETAINYGVEKAMSNFSNIQISNLSVLANYFKQFKGGRMSLNEAPKAPKAQININYLTKNEVDDVVINPRYVKEFKDILTKLNLDQPFIDQVVALSLNNIDKILDTRIKNINMDAFKKDYSLPPDLIEAIQMSIVKKILVTNGTFTKEFIDYAVINEINKITKYTKRKIPFTVLVNKLFKPKNVTVNTKTSTDITPDIDTKTSPDMDEKTLRFKKIAENKFAAEYGRDSRAFNRIMEEFETINLITTRTDLDDYINTVIKRLEKDKFKFNSIIKIFGSIGAFISFIGKFLMFIKKNPGKFISGYFLIYELIDYTFNDFEGSFPLHLQNMAKLIGETIKNTGNTYKKALAKQTANDAEKPRNKSTLQPGQLDE